MIGRPAPAPERPRAGSPAPRPAPAGRRRRLASLGCAAALALACGAAPAARAGTALVIHAPDGFTVKQSTPDADDDTGYGVEAVADPDVGCQVNLTGTKHASGRDQAALNAAAADPGYLARVRADLAGLFDVREVAPFSMQGAEGSVATADPKVGDGALRAAVFDLDVPRGNLEVLCVSSADEFDAWRPLFERIARGVELPR